MMEGSDALPADFIDHGSSSNPKDDFPFKFGDDQTADVVLTLEAMEGETYARLHLHSHVLCQSEFFKARLSERWASSHDKLPLQLTLDGCKNLQMYVACMKLMYVPKESLYASFGSVEEAIGILEVASQLLFHACITGCMHYLEIVAWSIEEEELIRSCISTFHLTPTPGLADKLSMPDKPVDVMKDTILSLIRHGAMDIAEGLMIDNVEPIFFSTFGTLNDGILLEELQWCVRPLINDLGYGVMEEDEYSDYVSRLEFILDQLDKCQVAEKVFEILTDDQEVVDAISRGLGSGLVSSFVNHMFGALQNGKVMASIAVRVALLCKWLPIIAELDCKLLKGEMTCNVVKSLPLINQMMIFKIWIKSWCKLYGYMEEDALSSHLRWILNQLDKSEVAEITFEILADKEVVNAIWNTMSSNELFFSFVNQMFGILQNGKVMVSVAVRVALLSKWLPDIANLDCKLLKGELLCNAVKSLPMTNQEMIFKVWIKSCCKPRILEKAFSCWCQKLRRTRKDHNAEPSDPEPMELHSKVPSKFMLSFSHIHHSDPCSCSQSISPISYEQRKPIFYEQRRLTRLDEDYLSFSQT